MRCKARIAFVIALGMVALVAALSNSVGAEEAATLEMPAIDFALTDLQGTSHELGKRIGGPMRVYVFLSTECPISNSYAQTLNELAKHFTQGENAAEFFGVMADPTVERDDAAKHFQQYNIAFPVLYDDAGRLAQVLKPTHVPEAFVLNRQGQLVYRGAIDNAWERLGRRRPQVQRRYLHHAMQAVANGQPVEVARTKPVGCLFEAEFPSSNGNAR